MVETGNDVGVGFSYNPASQVVARAHLNSTYDYPIGVVNQTYTSNGRNQYTQIAGTAGGTLGWDLNGNLTSDGLATPTTFAYDTENRLTSATGAKTATLTYDPMGRLYQVSNAAGTTRFFYDGDRLILEYNGSGAIQRRYVHGAGVDEPVVWYEGSAVSSAARRYLHADHQGSIVSTANAAGAKLDIGTYDAYGVTTAPSTWRFQYTGQTAIQQVGLYYYKARFYNPALGRFMQTDPIGYDDDVNLYSYVGNDPLNNTDPTGKFLAVVVEGVSVCAANPACRALAVVTAAYVSEKVSEIADLVRENIVTSQSTESASDATPSDETTPSESGERRRSNPMTGEPGSTSSTTTRDGRPKQDRTYGEDGYPDQDVDHDHPHDGVQPHVHDWARPSDGSAPTNADRGPGRDPDPEVPDVDPLPR